MGRHLSPEHHQALVAHWTQHLRDIPWDRLSKTERLVHLASLVGAEAAPMAADVRTRLTVAVSELLEV